MQVATLFRESQTLLGATMESANCNGPGGSCSGSSNSNTPNTSYGASSTSSSTNASSSPPISSELKDSCSPQQAIFNQTAIDHQHRFKPIPNETQDDGYETSADMVLAGRILPSGTEQIDDPYSFVDDEAVEHHSHPHPHHSQHHHNSSNSTTTTTGSTTTTTTTNSFNNTNNDTQHHNHHNRNLSSMSMQHSNNLPSNYLHSNNSILLHHPNNSLLPVPRKRGRKKKIKLEDNGSDPSTIKTKPTKERKKHDRFNGMPEEEVSKRTLPDHLTENLDIIIIGINPGLFAAYKGHHYAGPGNHFWKCLYLSGLTPEQMSADEDYKLLQVGIGFTNMVQRATKGSADLTRKEIKEGSQILLEKLQHFKPKIAVFNGKLIYEVFSGKKDFSFGRQPDLVDGTNTYMWVMPSSSARCAQLPRAADKVPFYAALKKFRDYLNGMVAIIDDSEVVFSEARIKSGYDSESRNSYPMDIMDISNATVKREDNSIVPCKKKRGRPKKIKVEGEEVIKPPPVKRVYNQISSFNNDGTKKKRGRPKKIRPEDKPMDLVPIGDAKLRPHSPVQPFCHMQQQQQPQQQQAPQQLQQRQNQPSSYTMCNTPTPVQPISNYMQSPRPQSQPFTHSDLSSEISAAISSEHLESPTPTSPSLDPPDFDPPTNMPTEDTTECCFSSPTPSTISEHPTPPMIRPITYPSYNTYSPDLNRTVKSEYKVQDMSTKSLSGLESLVDQIPSIADGDAMSHANVNVVNGVPNQTNLDISPESHSSYHDVTIPNTTSSFNLTYPANNSLSVSSLTNPANSSFSVSSFTSGYINNGNSYPNLMSPPMHHPFMEHHNCGVSSVPVPMPLSYHQLAPPYSQQYPGSYGVGSPPSGGSVLHMPSPNYPNGYGYSGYGHQPTAPPPSYLANHMFDRIKPDPGYGE